MRPDELRRAAIWVEHCVDASGGTSGSDAFVDEACETFRVNRDELKALLVERHAPAVHVDAMIKTLPKPVQRRIV